MLATETLKSENVEPTSLKQLRRQTPGESYRCRFIAVERPRIRATGEREEKGGGQPSH
jgi:hypothetical protein